jgi:2-dehydropantoate 2-reductase
MSMPVDREGVTMNQGERRAVVYGAGAIGGTVGGWLAEAGVPVTFVARPVAAKLLNEQGLRLYEHGHQSNARTVRVTAVTDFADVADAEIVVLAVKNFDLDGAASDIRSKLHHEPLVVALQNGVDNQSILPGHFRRVVYGVLGYNAWCDGANEFGYATRGPVLLGVTDESLVADRDRLVALFSKGFDCRAEERITDAALCKMLFNLMTAIMAVVGVGVREVEDYGAFKDCVVHVLYEGVQVLQAAGVREVRITSGGSWASVRALRFLPGFVSSRIVRNILRRFHMTSMAQDVYVAKRSVTELESLNGYFVRLADSSGVAAPYNRKLHRIMREWLAQGEIHPMHERELWARLREA